MVAPYVPYLHVVPASTGTIPLRIRLWETQRGSAEGVKRTDGHANPHEHAVRAAADVPRYGVAHGLDLRWGQPLPRRDRLRIGEGGGGRVRGGIVHVVPEVPTVEDREVLALRARPQRVDLGQWDLQGKPEPKVGRVCSYVG